MKYLTGTIQMLLRASLMALWQRICLPMKETQIQSLGQEDPLKKERATLSTILSWEIPLTKEPAAMASVHEVTKNSDMT